MARCMKCGKPIRNNRSICSFCDGHMCGYDKGRADAMQELKDKSVFYSNKPIEEIVFEARRDAIDECKTILKTQHMIRTAEDDFCAKVEIPFYRKLWKRMEQLKEQNNG